jgi:DNA-binding NarL/FixJ family response regulator
MRPLSLNILVVDDHALMRESVRAILETDDGFEVVGEAESAGAAVEQAGALRPDVILLDLRLPDADGFACLDALARRVPEAAVIVFSAVDEPELVSAALDRGAAGYILKRISPVDLPAAIRGTVDGSVVHVQRLSGRPNGAGLSPKEHDVLEQLAQGRSNREIASQLWISDQTVKFHLRNVYRKLGASTRTEAIRIAHEQALVRAA